MDGDTKQATAFPKVHSIQGTVRLTTNTKVCPRLCSYSVEANFRRRLIKHERIRRVVKATPTSDPPSLLSPHTLSRNSAALISASVWNESAAASAKPRSPFLAVSMAKSSWYTASRSYLGTKPGVGGANRVSRYLQARCHAGIALKTFLVHLLTGQSSILLLTSD